MKRSVFVICFAVLAAAPGFRIGVAAAQTGEASLMGIVQSAEGAPIEGAVVTIGNESTGYETNRLTGPGGRFFVPDVPLGGPYQVSARMLGYRDETRTGYEVNLGDRLRVDFALQPAAVEVEGIVVDVDANAQQTRASGSLLISRQSLDAIPAQDRNFQNLVDLAPTAGSGLTLGGLRGTSTAFIIDGLNARNARLGRAEGGGAMGLSTEAIREFEVSTNEYDVTQGRQGGGAVRVATRSGTNELEGSLFVTYLNEALTTDDYAGRPPSEFDRRYFGFSLGGPVVRDRVHFFTTFERRSNTSPTYLWDTSTPDAEVDTGIAADSIARLLDILKSSYGLGGDAQTGAFTAENLGYNAFGKLDWTMSEDHRVTLSVNSVREASDPLQGPGPGIFEAKGAFVDRTLGFNGSLRSTLGDGVFNRFSTQYLFFTEERNPNAGYLPLGMVRIRSDLPDGTLGNVLVQFGGNRNMPADFPERQYQLTNVTNLQRGDLQFTVGTDNILTIYRDQYVAQEQLGRFDFSSLADLEAMRPNRFRREVPVRSDFPTGKQDVYDLSLFGQLTATPDTRLSVEAGVRWDVTAYGITPDRNEIVEQEFGFATNRSLPVDLTRIQPRLQLTLDRHLDRSELVKVGAGLFSPLPHHAPFYNAVLFNGLEVAAVDVNGADVPYPDFVAFRQDSGSIPGMDVDGGEQIGVINTISSDFRQPMLFKASASYERDLADWLRLGATALYSRGWNNYGFFDLNLRTDPFFTIEGGRGVLVPASTIATGSGQVNPTEAQVTDRLALVAELRSPGESDQKSLVVEGQARLPWSDALLNLSYTLNETRDNAAWNCCLAPTSLNQPVKDHPTDLSWGPSDWDFRHKLVAFGSTPTVWGINLSARYVGNSGSPFSLVVNQDINGDGSSNNDLAFVFDPDDPTTPPEVADAMRRVLSDEDSYARDYIRDNLGRIADRNGGRAPWSQRVDVRISRAVGLVGDQQLELALDAFNFLHLLNSDWGGSYSLGDRQTLLRVEGFDPTTSRFIYSVNENVGKTQKGGLPYQLQLGARYIF